MKIGPSAHGILDFLFVLFFLAAPAIFDLTGAGALVCYAVAVGHLGFSLLTCYPVGVLAIVPFPVLGAFELALALGLIAAPWLLDFAGEHSARTVCVGGGMIKLAVWLISDYRPAAHPGNPVIQL